MIIYVNKKRGVLGGRRGKVYFRKEGKAARDPSGQTQEQTSCSRGNSWGERSGVHLNGLCRGGCPDQNRKRPPFVRRSKGGKQINSLKKKEIVRIREGMKT